MPTIPFPTLCVAPYLCCVPGQAPFLLFPILPNHPSSGVRSRTMTAGATPTGREDSSEITDLRGFPTPLSPPHPPLSKQVELRRAMAASSRWALFALTGGDIVFEDAWLAVVNKPSGIYCETLLSAYSALVALPSSSSTPPPPPPTGGDGGAAAPELHLANRLDRDTSGLMVITKSHKAASKLVRAFTDHRVKKTYIALCTGRAPAWGRIRISSGHGRSKFGAWRVYSASDVGRALPGGSIVKHMATCLELLAVSGRGGHGEAETVVVEERAGAPAEEEETGREPTEEILVRAHPESGRTHQIRLHCQFLGMPIKGDVKYGGVCEWEGAACDSHALHAESLQLEHPVTGLPLRFCAPLPPWATQAFAAIV